MTVPSRPRSVAEVVADITAGVAPRGSERMSLLAAQGRVLASPATAPGPLPPRSRAAMDGAAVRAADVADARDDAPVILQLDGASFAGRGDDTPLAASRARTIATGADLPPGADAIVRLEELARRDASVEVRRPVAPGRDVRAAGEDAAAGTVLLAAGTRLGASQVGGLAGTGITEVDVWRPPRVAILPTGDEVVAGTTPDAVSPLLAGLLTAHGCEVDVAEPCRDDEAAIGARVQALAVDHDVVCTVGGVSVGPRDHGPAVVGAFGTGRWELLALRPGRRFAWARRDDQILLGLPGSPLAALVVAVRVVLPVVRAYGGVSPSAPRLAVAGAPFAAAADAERLVAAEWRGGTVHPVPGNGAADLARLARTRLLAGVEPGQDVPRGGTLAYWDLP